MVPMFILTENYVPNFRLLNLLMIIKK